MSIAGHHRILEEMQDTLARYIWVMLTDRRTQEPDVGKQETKL